MASHRYRATVQWERNGQDFLDNQYRRDHRWVFDAGIEVPASCSPLVVPPPQSNENAVDPEEALVASAASCHMLWFLSLAAREGFVVERYVDQAVGLLEKDAQGKMAITVITLRPLVGFAGRSKPSAQELADLHQRSHDQCFIANSLKSEIRVEGR